MKEMNVIETYVILLTHVSIQQECRNERNLKERKIGSRSVRVRVRMRVRVRLRVRVRVRVRMRMRVRVRVRASQRTRLKGCDIQRL